MNIFIHENLPAQIAQGLQLLEDGNDEGVSVKSIKAEFGTGAKDEDWIPELGKLKAIVITQDHNIHRKQLQRQLYQQHKVDLVVFKSLGKHGYIYWQMVENIIKHWQEIKDSVRDTKPPFAFVITPRSSKITPL